MIKNKTSSSPWVLLFPLLIAFLVIGFVLISAANKNSSADIRSHASSQTVLQQCTSACTNPKYKAIVKDSGKCALDCTKVSTGTTDCSTFCSVNTTAAGSSLCKQQCQGWVASGITLPQRCEKLCSTPSGNFGPLDANQKKRCLDKCEGTSPEIHK